MEGHRRVLALHDFDARTPDELTFRKRDILKTVSQYKEGQWWLAEHTETGAKGYIPGNYVIEIDNLYGMDWYHGKITRKNAEQLLLPRQPRGLFLIRESETTPGTFVLSVRDYGPKERVLIRHYRISNMGHKRGYHITTQKTFDFIEELVAYYTEHIDGLCHKLVKACPKATPQILKLSKYTIDQLEIPRESLQFSQRLGAGQFGEVWQELLKNGSLLDYLRNGDGQYIKLPIMIDMAAQIASGMAYLESKQLVHRNLTAKSIHVGENNEVKIADFAFVRLAEDGEHSTRQGATFSIKWAAPEVANFGKFTIKSDVWSYGILLVEIITRGQTPYPGMTNKEVLQQVDQGYRMSRPMGCPGSTYEILLKCWSKKAVDRPTFVFLSGFFEEVFVNIDQII